MQAIRTYFASIDVKDVAHKALCCTPIVSNLYKTVFYIYAYRQCRNDSDPQNLQHKLRSLNLPSPRFQLAVRVICAIGVTILCPPLLYPLLVVHIATTIPYSCTTIHDLRNQQNIPWNLQTILRVIPIVKNLYGVVFYLYSLGDAACTHNWERFKRRVSEKVDSKFMIAQTTGNALRLLFPAKLLIADEIIGAVAAALWFTARRVGYSHRT